MVVVCGRKCMKLISSCNSVVCWAISVMINSFWGIPELMLNRRAAGVMDFCGIRLRVSIALVLSNLWIGYWIIAVAENTSLWYLNILFSKIIFTNEPLLWFLKAPIWSQRKKANIRHPFDVTAAKLPTKIYQSTSFQVRNRIVWN